MLIDENEADSVIKRWYNEYIGVGGYYWLC